MTSTRSGIRNTAVLVISCVALCGCALQSSRPAAAAQGGGAKGTSPDVWRYARTITLDTTAAGANVPDDVANYPLAVLLDKSRFDFSQARADGADIRFFDAGGQGVAARHRAVGQGFRLCRDLGTCSMWSKATAGISRS